MQVLIIFYITAIILVVVMTITHEIRNYKTKKMVKKAIENCYKAVEKKVGGINE